MILKSGFRKLISLSRCCISGIFIVVLAVHSVEAGGGVFTIPPLEIILPLALEKNQGSSLSPGELKYRVKDHYYQVQYRTEQLGISEEVKKHFEKAVDKSEEQFDSAEGDVSQSDITKLKLGLSGTLNDIIEAENEIHLNKLNLAKLTGMEFTYESKLEEDTIHPASFPHTTFEEFLGQYGLKKIGDTQPQTRDIKSGHRLTLEMAYVNVDAARAKLDLAKDSRKITRALLVTEVANYDFGIGVAGDLFEALIIYTRVLRGYYEAVYGFNLAVAEMERDVANIFSPAEMNSR